MPSHAPAICRALDRATRRREIPVVVCIDVEPDARQVDREDPVPWLGFERLLERVPTLRDRLTQAARAPVAFSWFLRMDPQVADTWGSAAWVAETYGDALADLAGRGDEMGVHPHTHRWDSHAGLWISDNEDPAWGKHCATMALDAFEKTFGRPCAAHRGGDHLVTEAILACLQARSVRVDLTVEPGLPALGSPDGNSRGLSPDYRGVPTGPYRSSPAGFPAPDRASRSDPPLLIPLLSAPGKRGRSPLSPLQNPGRFALRLGAELLRTRIPVIAVALRSNAVLGDHWKDVETNLEHLARHRRMPFVTASTAAGRLGG